MRTASVFLLRIPQSGEHLNARFSAELGAAILLGKPIIGVFPVGLAVPENILSVCDEVIRADDLDERATKQIAEAIMSVRQLHAGRDVR